MNTKEKKELIKKICKDCNPTKETFFAIYSAEGKGSYDAIGDMGKLREGIYEILKSGLSEDASKAGRTIAHNIISGVYDFMDSEVFNDDDDDAEDEDDDKECYDCELLRVCEEERAIAWRKKLGIPKPKKHGHKTNKK